MPNPLLSFAHAASRIWSDFLQNGKAQRSHFRQAYLLSTALLSLPSVALAAVAPVAPQQQDADAFLMASPPPPEIDYLVTPVNREVTLVLRNNTGAQIQFEAVGQTDTRLLPSFSNTTLTNLPLPLLFTFRRPDNGFLQVNVQTNQPQGVVEVTFSIAPNFEADRNAISINERGEISVN